jgi:hypothetical protein
MAFGLIIGFIDHLQVVTTNNDYAIVDFHAVNPSTLSLLSLFPLVLVTALHNSYPSAVSSLDVS